MKKMKLGGIALAIGLLCFMGVAYGPSVSARAPYQQTQAGNPTTVTMLGSSWDWAGDTNVTGAVCSPCGWQSLGNSTGPINGSLATIMMDDGIYGFGDTVALGFSDFGLSVPDTATIDGIRLVIAADSTDATTTNMVLALSLTASQPALTWFNSTDASWYGSVNLLHTGGWVGGPAPTGNEITYSGAGTGLSAPFTTAGGPTALWGGLLTPGVVNNSNFGVVTHSSAAAPGGVLSIDGMTMTVFYTTAAAAPTATGWVLGLLGIALVLAAALTLRKRALPIALALALLSVPAMATTDGYNFATADNASGAWWGLGGDDDIATGVDYSVTWDIIAPIDPFAASGGGWYTFRPWGANDGAGGGGITFGAHNTDFPGTNRVQGRVDDAAVFTGFDLGANPVPIRLHIERIANVDTFSYGPVGGPMTTLATAAVTPTLAGDIGVYFEHYCADGSGNFTSYNCAGPWKVDRVEHTIGGVTTVYEGALDTPLLTAAGTDWGNSSISAYAAQPANTAIAWDVPNPFPSTGGNGFARWTLNFDEPVTGTVLPAMFTVAIGGDGAYDGNPPVVIGGGTSYTVSVDGVTSTTGGSVGLVFDPAGAIITDAGGLAIPDGILAPIFDDFTGAPTANNWVLVFMGIVLALAATVVIRKRALDH